MLQLIRRGNCTIYTITFYHVINDRFVLAPHTAHSWQTVENVDILDYRWLGG